MIKRPYGLIYKGNSFIESILAFKDVRSDRVKFQRIEDMRIDRDITIKEISIELGLHRDVYARYEKGIRDFPIDVLCKLADYYNCSLDYLVNRTDKKEINK